MKFILMDLERTLSSGVPAFWKSNKRGYSYNILKKKLKKLLKKILMKERLKLVEKPLKIFC